VWLSPIPLRTRQAGQAAGLRLVDERPVDLGGFMARLQVFRGRVQQ
jgi:hypothetical protein